MRVVDLFCGAGGFSQGAVLAGAEVILAVEGDPNIALVYQQNFGHHLQVKTLDTTDIEPLVQFIQEHSADLHCHGSPPCQKLSQANKRSGDDEEGLRLVKLYLEIVAQAKPRTWSMEQVNNASLRVLLDEQRVEYTIVNTQDFGVPQSRKRLVAGSACIIKHLRDHRGTGPTILPKDVLTLLQPESRFMLVSGTDNQPLREKRGNKLVTVGWRPMHFGEGARNLQTPAHTVWGKPGKVVDLEKRVLRNLNPRECAQLQGFPDSFQLDGRSVSRSHKVIGNAVPPPLARVIIECAGHDIKNHSPANDTHG